MPAFLRFSLLAVLAVATPLRAARIVLYGESFVEPVAAALDQVRLPYERLVQGQLAGRDPATVDALFLAYDAASDTTVLSWSASFLDSGGRLFTFYVLPSPLQQRLGIRQGEYLRPEENIFTQIRTLDRIPHLPAAVRQRSWNIYQAFPAADSVQVIATWTDQQGQDTGHPSLLLGPRGAHLTHVLLDHDTDGAARLYAGLLGHFFPEVWPAAVRGALQAADQVGGGPETLNSLASRSKKARQDLARAAQIRQRALDLLAEENYGEALSAAFQTRDLTVRAFARGQTSRPGEFRAVWLHSPYGVADWGWEKTCRFLAKHGFNAIVPNMLDAGLTSYPSQVLPADPRVREQGDQLRQAVDAAHRHGLAIHAWKVNYNLHSADSAFVARLRREGRLQQNPRGEEIEWLCPSHPENFALEVASMLEVVRRYEVDGLHFDYIRYPHAEGCYDAGCRLRFETQTGHQVASWPEDVITGERAEVYQRWRQEQITRLVRAVSVQARQIRPEIEISAAVFPDWPQTRLSIGQDWVRWIEAGYVDFICPMDYIPEMERFCRTVRRQVDWVAGRVPLYIGIGAFRLPAADDLIRQIAWTRRAGADGFVLFQYDTRLGEKVLPLLREGMTREKTHPAHRGPYVSFEVQGEVTEGMEPGARFYAADEALSLRGHLIESALARAARGHLSLRSLDGALVQELDRVDPKRPQVEVSLVLPPGDYRPVIAGRYRDVQGKKRDFARRGPVLRVRGRAFRDSLAQLYGPPLIPAEGTPVGVFVDGYGGSSLLQVLEEQQGLAAFPVRYLTPTVLEATRVLVIPQPRQRGAIDRAARLSLRRWIAAGGRLLVTHDLAGIRGLLPVVPEVCRRGTGFPRSVRWQATADHPAVAGLPSGLHPHSYYDHIVLESGPHGAVLAADDEGRPVLVVGPHGDGRYAALGLVPGLASDDQEVLPEGAERKLVESLVGWLAAGL